MAPLPTQPLRDALDRLRAGDPGEPSLWERLAGGEGALPETPELIKLDEELARAGVHTLADARLLGRLARKEPRAKTLAAGLHRRTAKALDELESLVAALARAQRRTGQPSETGLRRAEDCLARLERALAIERAMAAPEKPAPGDAAPLFRPSLERAPPSNAALATVERYADRAGAQAVDVRRKRRDLDRAHALLLALAAQLAPDDRARAQQLRARLADERHRLEAVEHLVLPGERLPEAAARALAQGRAADAYAGLLAVYRGALESRDATLAETSRAALGHLWDAAEVPEGGLVDDAARALRDRLGDGALREVLDAKARAERDLLVETAFELTPEHFALFNLALSAGEFFDTSVVEEEVEDADPALAQTAEKLRRVPFPTPTMDFAQARGVEELRDFVIRDPRLVLYDLASGTQLVRAYYESNDSKPRRTRRSAVRVYVCDASGSMRGPRARFRDAILIAELNNLSLRARAGKEVWPVYYAFFTDRAEPLHRVDTPARAFQVMADLFDASPARGRTDITYALCSAFEAIHEARGRDPDLARATVVLVTDGEDQVELARISAARAPVGDLEITLNFISLGEENADLRHLVLEQRERGRRAFYTHLSDDDIVAGASPFEPSLRTLLPERPELSLTPDAPAVRAALDALAAITAGAPLPQGPSAATRFEAYFPEALPPATGPAPQADVERVADLLDAVAEALALAGLDERPSEAVELLEHLLGLYHLPLERYRAVLGTHHASVRQRVARVRRLAGFAVFDAVEPAPPAAGA